jgi:hypothetical protein
MPSGGAGSGGMAGRAGSGGASGGAGSGGAAGGGGSSGAGRGGCAASTASLSDALIDNLEDDDQSILPPRVGYWFTYSDLSLDCRVSPPPDPNGTMPFEPTNGAGRNASIGARFSGSGCATWGAGMGFILNVCDGRSDPYNALVFRGIAFWYRSTTPVRLQIVTLADLPPSSGGTCSDGDANCYNYHGALLAAAPSGALASLEFSTLTQEFGAMRMFDKTELVNIEFQVNQIAQPFDVTVDDVAFFP